MAQLKPTPRAARLRSVPRLAAPLLALALAAPAGAQSARPVDAVDLGRYLVRTAGCNDCHSPGYAQQGGRTPEASWLTGDGLGWRGPWGTTYPANLRLLVAGLDEEQWLQHVRTMRPRPPMPWYDLQAMSETDLRAIYRYVRQLGPAGQAAPAYRPPGTPVAGPVVQFPGAP